MKNSFLFRYWKTLSITLLILILCLIPAAEIQKLHVKITFADLVVHFTMYLSFVFVILLDFSKGNNKSLKTGSLILISIIAGVLFGGLTETLQLVLTFLNRSGNLVDLSFDLLGSLAGVILFLLYRKMQSAKSCS
jgi:VanZ family protein